MNLCDEIMSPIWVDELSGMRTTFLRLPLEYLHHDHKINPRAIGNSIPGLIEEFHRKRPQLHIPLAWIDTTILVVHGCAYLTVSTRQLRRFYSTRGGCRSVYLSIRTQTC
jgi:hypothetical protein